MTHGVAARVAIRSSFAGFDARAGHGRAGEYKGLDKGSIASRRENLKIKEERKRQNSRSKNKIQNVSFFML
jgi:hypothetical protein